METNGRDNNCYLVALLHRRFFVPDLGYQTQEDTYSDLVSAIALDVP